MQKDHFTKYLMENAGKQGFHKLNFNYTFLSNGVNAVCTLERYKGLELEVLDQGFFSPTISEATEELSKFMSINYLGAEEIKHAKQRTADLVPGRILAIYNVHPRTTKDDFLALFQHVGVFTTSSKRYENLSIYFFEFETRYDANIVYVNYCGKELDGRKLEMKYMDSMP